MTRRSRRRKGGKKRKRRKLRGSEGESLRRNKGVAKWWTGKVEYAI